MTPPIARLPIRGGDDVASPPTVAIIGGGVAGASLAYQLARKAPGAFRIVVIEPRGRLGLGVAYSTKEPACRINVDATQMSFLPDDPDHFQRWLETEGAVEGDPEATLRDGRVFPRRSEFGRYCSQTLAPLVRSGAVRHLEARARSLRRLAPTGYSIALSDGRSVTADFAVLATGHPPPEPPRALAGAVGDRRLIRDTQATGSLDGIDPDARLLIVGTGLTMADIVASLTARGHRGRILAVSRRGLLSRGHAGPPGRYGEFADAPDRTALSVLRRIRRTIRQAAQDGVPWQQVIAAVRADGPAIWARLPDAERRNVLRRLRPFWDVHRFRIAPQVEDAVQRRLVDGTLRVLRGEPLGARASDDGLLVELIVRPNRPLRLAFDHVILATGPAHRNLADADPLIADLVASGTIALDGFGLGFATDATSRALGAGGTVAERLFVAGPLARGTFGELMGQPEVTAHAATIAGEIVKAGARADDRGVSAA